MDFAFRCFSEKQNRKLFLWELRGLCSDETFQALDPFRVAIKPPLLGVVVNFLSIEK
jgi:hypothetical protein